MLKAKLKIFLFGVVLLVIIVFLVFTLNSFKDQDSKIARACFGDFCFELEIAKTNEERALGLMYRENLPDKNGMLFIFGQLGLYPFWMKNTLISLDILWLDADGEVIFIKHNALPCQQDACPSINPNSKAQYVLELNAGKAFEIGVNIGDKISLLDI